MKLTIDLPSTVVHDLECKEDLSFASTALIVENVKKTFAKWNATGEMTANVEEETEDVVEDVKEGMVEFGVTAYPYVNIYGTIWVPENLDEDERRSYINDHWDDIEFGEPEFDYAGTDWDLD